MIIVQNKTKSKIYRDREKKLCLRSRTGLKREQRTRVNWMVEDKLLLHSKIILSIRGINNNSEVSERLSATGK